MARIFLEIKGEDDRSTVAAILVRNDYTVRKASRKIENTSRKIHGLEIWKDSQEELKNDK